ncbi:uncharacterized protein EV420DRAFT_1648223 [Desarmillaria tabescens]|uniref:F-box domain-containing protein n=1 Tax=Armillaria tabescens TaxID=1929756 RepID=A0AA39JPD2_ARMTA|nr:uncharacterized protein EV420DRAFT_1648223 [Desarmillaria tabescens]KAK0445992.1 hypothetical protein EV420DRAFT_1648223 [Desarmillaria tabescens]
MSCLTCSNCGFVNFLPPEPQLQTLQTIQSSDNLISQVLRGSRTLLDSEHASMREEIAKLEPLRSWYDVQLQEIQLRRHAVLKALENRESIYTPIRRLPRDILVEIFHSVCDIWWQGADEDELRDSLDLSGPLWALSRVCGLWRDVLHSSPASWARYVLVKFPFSKHACEILQTYLERTGEHPLSLMIINDSTRLILDGEIIPLLVQSCHRWKNVRIRTTLRHTHCLDSISHLPVLQTIEIDITDDDDYCSNICLNAPRLWQATLPSQGISQVKLPPGITHYSGHITCPEDLQLLSQLPKLRTCHLESSWMSPASFEAPVVMAELRELYVQDLDILKLLTAPILQSLTITADIPKSLSNVTLFFHRSGCRLESFSICMDVLESEPPTSISNMFSSEACSTISHLKLELGSVWYNIARALTSSSILSNLHRLILCFENQYFRHSQTERLPLLDMIRSRRDAGLKTIEVQFNEEEGSDFDDRDIEADIRILIGDNLEMRVEKWSSLHLDHRLLF